MSQIKQGNVCQFAISMENKFYINFLIMMGCEYGSSTYHSTNRYYHVNICQEKVPLCYYYAYSVKLSFQTFSISQKAPSVTLWFQRLPQGL
jgi:hypothetical protein